MAEPRVSDERLATEIRMFHEPLPVGDDHPGVRYYDLLCDFRDARAEIARLKAERHKLVERAVRAGFDEAEDYIRACDAGVPYSSLSAEKIADRILAEFDAEKGAGG